MCVYTWEQMVNNGQVANRDCDPSCAVTAPCGGVTHAPCCWASPQGCHGDDTTCPPGSLEP